MVVVVKPHVSIETLHGNCHTVERNFGDDLQVLFYYLGQKRKEKIELLNKRCNTSCVLLQSYSYRRAYIQNYIKYKTKSWFKELFLSYTIDLVETITSKPVRAWLLT